MMKVVVNLDVCMSNAQCVLAAPEVFEIREDGMLYVLQEEPSEALRINVENAARLCPTQAITIEK
jgi:ferredoxin